MHHLLRADFVLQSSLNDLSVTAMTDGGMGSLLFGYRDGRKMGRELVEASAVDADGVPLLLSVNLDEAGNLFELDIWKVDFSPLKRLPQPMDVQIMESKAVQA